jgi:hypothetical protein
MRSAARFLLVSALVGWALGSGCGSFLCPDADPGWTYCGMCPSPSNCFYCPGAMCPADPCTATCDGSAARGGGGGGGGAACAGGTCSGAAICVSTRACVVSAMGNGCDCAGTTSGQCHDYSGTGAAGQACVQSGGACGTSSTPMCCPGLSCNNSRCEGASGRCPF